MTSQSQSRKSFIKSLSAMGSVLILPKLLYSNAGTPTEMKGSLSDKKRVLRVAHLTDIHVQPEKTAEKGFTSALRRVNDLQEKVDFIINGGDAIMNSATFSKEKVKAQWKAFHLILKDENSLGIHHCIGNHDLYGWAIPGTNHQDVMKWAMDEYQLTNSYYSFSRGSWKFIILNSIQKRKSLPGYYGKIDEEQFQWLGQELRSVSDSTHICVVSHIPILAICTLFDKKMLMHNRWTVPDNCMHADAIELRDMFYNSRNVKACLSGHIHLIDHVNYLGTDYYCDGAVSGGWWKGSHQQFPPAFAVINFYDDGTTSREIQYYDWG